jgi:hypothetical protein
MKLNRIFMSLFAASLLFVSCGKKDDEIKSFDYKNLPGEWVVKSAVDNKGKTIDKSKLFDTLNITNQEITMTSLGRSDNAFSYNRSGNQITTSSKGSQKITLQVKDLTKAKMTLKDVGQGLTIQLVRVVKPKPGGNGSTKAFIDEGDALTSGLDEVTPFSEENNPFIDGALPLIPEHNALDILGEDINLYGSDADSPFTL